MTLPKNKALVKQTNHKCFFHDYMDSKILKYGIYVTTTSNFCHVN